MCRFSDAGRHDLTPRLGGRRPKSAKAGNRGMGDDGGAAGMGNLPRGHGLMRCNNAAARARLPRGHELDWSRERATGFLLALTVSFCVVPIDEI